jgi:hypothetical protein
VGGSWRGLADGRPCSFLCRVPPGGPRWLPRHPPSRGRESTVGRTQRPSEATSSAITSRRLPAPVAGIAAAGGALIVGSALAGALPGLLGGPSSPSKPIRLVSTTVSASGSGSTQSQGGTPSLTGSSSNPLSGLSSSGSSSNPLSGLSSSGSSSNPLSGLSSGSSSNPLSGLAPQSSSSGSSTGTSPVSTASGSSSTSIGSSTSSVPSISTSAGSSTSASGLSTGPSATTVHTGLWFAGSTPYLVAMGSGGVLLLGWPGLRRLLARLVR